MQDNAAVVVGGDFNCRPQDFEMVMLRKLLPELQDSWATVHPDEPGYTSNAEDQGEGNARVFISSTRRAIQTHW